MTFDPNNPIIKLCAQGMEMEGKGEPEAAAKLFMQAWDESTTDFEKFTAAHYVARHQKSIAEKLTWDETALKLALGIDTPAIKATLPSLYLNVAKCYEDLDEKSRARENYQLALSHSTHLPEDGYGSMIRSGINSGLARVQ